MSAIQIDRYTFEYVCPIIPLTNPNGTIQENLPHSRYNNVSGFSTHQYGQGPFCTFRIPNNLPCSGVYAITVNNAIAYIGECANLSQRFNSGYGQISPRNPFEGGQTTNCMINTFILAEIKNRRRIDLWFHATTNYKAIEAELRSKIKLPWNRI